MIVLHPLTSKPIGLGAGAIGSSLLSLQKFSPPLTIPTVVSAIRGGAIDIERSIVRIDAIGAYPVVAAILMNAMLDMHMDTPKVIRKIPADTSKFTSIQIKIENAVTFLFSLINTLSIASAGYSIVVFTLVFIYSKTAIGMGLDESFLKFTAATVGVRMHAFRACLASVPGFLFSLSLSRFLKEKGIIRWIESVTTFIIAVITVVHCKSIVSLASSLIYSMAYK
eukprot:CAMPEP_0172572342 /NCGR_PEP_ID=MMETSP1067-20121228/134752_1 /TAXON_ID=265564 ORGANISM="Thalassiosira punctigera, Strain Tpunct2005C2" /NCGR_SAMPLE_ID=MMETSP1067 /ASSEMBLY_ACC=CAM_ASM_000444 /LENGTH=223 /DNA_ID=CAMNT_0013364863 /DNA_START=147 /DNA_END=818 /DNA_ORIENTATION=+